MTKEIAIVYMVAGLSSRFEGKPKWLSKVGPEGESFIEYSIKQALPAGFTKIIFIVGDKTEKIFKEAFGDNYKGLPIQYALQKYDPEKRDRPWGTGDAVCSALPLIEGPCVICNGDDLYGKEAFKETVNHIQTTNEDTTTAFKLKNMVPEEGEVTRGIFKAENNYLTDADEIFGISKINYKEKNLNNESLCNTNLFGLQKKTLQKLCERVAKFKQQNQNDRKIESFIHVELANLVKSGETKMRIYISDEPWLGLTNPEDEKKVREQLRIKNPN